MQLLLVVEDAQLTDASPDKYSVRTEPKLRADLADGSYAIFTSPKGMFRMVEPAAEWSANHVSNYSMGFSCVEVI